MKKYYAVQSIKKRHPLDTPWGSYMLPINWADGMVGALPVFTNKKLAKKYAGDVGIVVFEQAEEK